MSFNVVSVVIWAGLNQFLCQLGHCVVSVKEHLHILQDIMIYLEILCFSYVSLRVTLE